MDLSPAGGGGAGPGPGGRALRTPHVITDLGEVHAAVEKLLQEPLFCFDVETDSLQHRTNEVTWIALGAHGAPYLIPMGHPKGRTIEPAHKERVPAFLLYGADDPRSFTKLGKPSMRLVERTVEATFEPPPRQLPPDQVFAALKPLMFSDRGKLGHNVKFDLLSVAKYYGALPPGPYHDTIVLRHVLNEELTEYGLKHLTCEWFAVPQARRKTFYPELGKAGVHNFGIDVAARYVAKDVRYCWLMFQTFFPRLARKGLQAVYDFEMEVYPVVMEMEEAGFPVDRSNLDKVRTDLEERLAPLAEEAWRMAGDQFPLSNTDAKRWVMFGDGPKPSYGVDPKSGRSTKRALKSQKLRVISRTKETSIAQITQPVLEIYADKGNRMAEVLLEWSQLEKLRGTFIEGLDPLLVEWPDRLPTLHTSFKQFGTVTGRFSSAGPNLQNLPRGVIIRDLFVAGQGYVLIVVDYDQIELRCLAKEANEQHMIPIFIRGEDIHRQAAAAAMRLALEEVTPPKRQVGKTLNFATGYGAGPNKIAAVAGVPVAEGQQFLDRYYARFSGLLPWKERMLAEARQRGDKADLWTRPPAVVIPPYGRLRRLPDLYNPTDGLRWRAERQAINALIQGFASYITKMAMVELAPQLRELGSQMVVQVHDEIVIRVPKHRVDEVLPLVVSTMGDVRGTDGLPILGDIPLVASAGVGYTWAEAKAAG